MFRDRGEGGAVVRPLAPLFFMIYFILFLMNKFIFDE